MITNFESITHELSEDELKLIPILVKGFSSHKEGNSIKAPEIVKQMNLFLSSAKPPVKLKMTEPRLRKMVNYIRTNGLIPLIATSNGYYVSYDHQVVESQMKSLYERASSIKKCADGLSKFL